MNYTALRLLAAGGVLAIAMTSAQASPPGFYWSMGAGRAKETPGQSIGLNIATGVPLGAITHINPDRVDVDNSSAAWNALVGYRVNPYVAAEVAYIDFGTADVTEHYSLGPSPFPVLPRELTHHYSSSVAGPALSVLGSLAIGARFDVFLRAGVFFADRKVKVSQSVGLGSTTFGSKVWVGGFGVDWSLASRWTIRAEYQRTDQLDTTFLASGTRVEQISLNVLFSPKGQSRL